MIPELPAEEIARRYDNSRAVPDWRERLLPVWQRRAAELRAQHPEYLGLAYGERERERIDLLLPRASAPARGWPLFVFIHGGYWQWTMRHDWTAVAEPFLAEGIACAVLGYTPCPEVSLATITDEVVQAMTWLWNHADELALDQDALVLAGHSAGGHLSAWCQTLDWTTQGLPATPFRAAIGVSGLYDLEPLVLTPINAGLQLDRSQALALSPAYREKRSKTPFHAVVGGAELPEFLRQNELIAQAWPDTKTTLLPGEDHFSIIDGLMRRDGALFTLLYRLF